MINSWAAAAQAMINKNADSRAGAGDGARPARASGPTPAWCRRSGTALHGLRRSASRSAISPTDGSGSCAVAIGSGLG
jgi:hypothetical protein